jgi:hypothetical protein
MSSWSTLVSGTGAGPAWWSGLVSTRSRPGRPPPDGASGAETSALPQLSGSNPSSPWSLLGTTDAASGPLDLNQNGQWDASEIELWQAQQDSGRLAWLLIMLARGEVDRLRSEGGPVVNVEKSLRQAHQSFEQGDFSRAMALAGRAQSQARRARDQLKIRKDSETETEGQAARPDDPPVLDSENSPAPDRSLDATYRERLWGLTRQARQLGQGLAERPPPEYVELDV